jgi:kumamolisin
MIVNPYIAGNPVTGEEMFFGREDIFEFVKRTLSGRHRDNPIVLYGQRRTGKTSVLYHICRYLGPAYLCIFVDLHSLDLKSDNGFLWELARSIVHALRRDYGTDIILASQAEFLADARDRFRSEFLPSIHKAISPRRLLLMIDELGHLYETIESRGGDSGVPFFLRYLSQHYDWLDFIYSFSGDLIEIPDKYAPSLNINLSKKVSFLSYDAAVELINKPAEDQYAVEPAAIDKIFEMTSGHPYFTQLICHSLFAVWMQNRVERIGVAEVERSIPLAIELGSINLKYEWEQSSPGERAVMAALCVCPPTRSKMSDVSRVWAKKGLPLPDGEITRSIHHLVDRDILAGDDRYRFTIYLQREWVRQHQKLDWVKEQIASAFAGFRAPTEQIITASSRHQASFTVPELASLYNFPTDLDGRGQCIGLVELGGRYLKSDLDIFFKGIGIKGPEVRWVSVDHARPSASGADPEVTLDIEVVGAVAPAAKIVVYFAPNTTAGFIHAIATAAQDDENRPSVLLITWGASEQYWTTSVFKMMNAALARAAARGITVCAASAGIDLPGSSPYVLACGGSSLTVANDKIVSEIVWNHEGRTSGGGASQFFPSPAWQAHCGVPQNKNGKPGRGVPDVAAHAGVQPGYQIVFQGNQVVVGGVTAAASLWAGLIALLNQGVGFNLGCFTPFLYSVLGPAGVLRDITSDNQDVVGAEGLRAGPGWDPCTGWGSPDGRKLLRALREHTPSHVQSIRWLPKAAAKQVRNLTKS